MVFSPMEPTLLMSFMEITPAAMENSTMGTTTNFSRFRKMSPQGLMYALAKSFPSMPPTLIFVSAIPAAMPTSRPTKIQNASGSFLLLSISHTPSKSGNARFFFFTIFLPHFLCHTQRHLLPLPKRSASSLFISCNISFSPLRISPEISCGPRRCSAFYIPKYGKL